VTDECLQFKMAENSKKKGRGDNFTFEDTQRLMKLAKKYAGIIECKKTDKYSWKQKVNGKCILTKNKSTKISLEICVSEETIEVCSAKQAISDYLYA
jgi:hypothetical protein